MEAIKKKYRVIAKTSHDPKDFKKWNVNNLVTFSTFLDKNFPLWCYFNVYEFVPMKYGSKGEKLASFTKNNRPIKKFL